jgi:DNA invertase Pin-like site-specific DNA recombinase
MSFEATSKVTATRLKRNAYLYIRQSSPRQVLENTESTKRQYGLRQRALALGWPAEQIIVIDTDLGQSAAHAKDREGFQRLVAEVGMGRAGIVLGLEVSRLARNSTDWHRLLEICALTDTLILDEDGIYDPAHFNDRLLLGLKGTMSEAELHVLQARMRGGVLNKAKRGELAIPLPIGFVYNGRGEVTLDPDEQVQRSVRLLFSTFRRNGSLLATTRAFREEGLKFPARVATGAQVGDLVWGQLTTHRARDILRNPRYTGAFVYGRYRTRKKADGAGRTTARLPKEEWHTFMPGAHPGYIEWAEYEENVRRLHNNARHFDDDRRIPPREGPALLQGLVRCGICGLPMRVYYRNRSKGLLPDYVCREDVQSGGDKCQQIPGAEIDKAIGELLIEAVSPLALEVALAVQQEIQLRIDDADRLRRTQVERARYEANLAQRRYLQVDPDNRLVADALEADWNSKLRALAEAQDEYERQHRADSESLSEETRNQILALATNFPRLWRDPNTPNRERKRMAHLILEDVTLIKDRQITAHIRFKGGAVRTLQLPVPLNAPQQRATSPVVVAEVDRLLESCAWADVANKLNESGYRTGEGNTFNVPRVKAIAHYYGLQSHYERLRSLGLLTITEIAQLLGITKKEVRRRHGQGLLVGSPCNDHREYLYERPQVCDPGPAGHVHRNEVQCDA